MSGVTMPRISVRGVPSTIFSNAHTDRTVAPPKMPSIGPGSKLRAASLACIASTSDPTMPSVNAWRSSGTVVDVVAGAMAAASTGWGRGVGVVVVVVPGVVSVAALRAVSVVRLVEYDA